MMRNASCPAQVIVIGAALASASAALSQPIRPDAINPGAGEVPFPHPVITEVYYHGLPRRLGGDANLDGLRAITGDEFVEIMNPHDKPIELGGYRILDGSVNRDWGIDFTFPSLTLEPGDRAVVFNGFRQDEIPGADGDRVEAPRMKNPHFGDAWVFSMRCDQPWQSFTNEADFCLLRSADGVNVDVVAWGANPEMSEAPPADSLRVALLPTEPMGSFQRVEPFGPMILHRDIDGRYYSPGEIPTPSHEKASGAKTDDAGTQGG